MLDVKNCDCLDLMKEYPDNYFELDKITLYIYTMLIWEI